ncbi:MAG TPA: NAD(P)/FAD-dependent oxidoreductase [Thermomicrobiales bacterium]|nr:NAD(P)/FAD-dependent oxidoreductase [Thermomicrobiales bacterium]
MAAASKPHVVIIGGGFAGLNAAKQLRDADVAVTIVDQHNHHTFQPLLYQVATASLSPADIAGPIRAILRRQTNLSVILAEVTGIDLARGVVHMGTDELAYDYLIIAAGSTDSYFGHDEWEKYAGGLKTLDDAVRMRNQILLGFEAAERAHTDDERRRDMTFAIIGGGPTGVELAGAIAEISRHSISRDFDRIDPRQARIILIDAGPRLLAAYPESLSKHAQSDLERLGVEVRLNALVTSVDERGLTLKSGDRIEAATRLWAAGVQASPLGRAMAVEVDRAGRVLVNPDLSIPGHPNVFVAGDLAALNGKDGKQLPGVAQVAMQQGRAAARNIMRSVAGEATVPFQYKDLGNMATIGRNRAVADIHGIHLHGFIAWVIWLTIHLVNLIGFRNRFVVMTQWIWSYLTFYRRVRLITNPGTAAD